MARHAASDFSERFAKDDLTLSPRKNPAHDHLLATTWSPSMSMSKTTTWHFLTPNVTQPERDGLKLAMHVDASVSAANDAARETRELVSPRAAAVAKMARSAQGESQTAAQVVRTSVASGEYTRVTLQQQPDDPQAVEAAAAAHRHQAMRRAVAYALRKQAPAAIAQNTSALLKKLDSFNWTVRYVATEALGKLEPDDLAQHADAVAAKLDDPDGLVRQAAVETLGKLEPDALVHYEESLNVMFEEGEVDVANAAARALRKLRDGPGAPRRSTRRPSGELG